MAGMIETCQFCRQVIPEKNRRETNGDVIRAMSNEELAVTLMCPNEMGMADIQCDRSDKSNCVKCLYDWLIDEVNSGG